MYVTSLVQMKNQVNYDCIFLLNSFAYACQRLIHVIIKTHNLHPSMKCLNKSALNAVVCGGEKCLKTNVIASGNPSV